MLGSIPGPIVLAALIDSEATTEIGAAFAVVGVASGAFATLFAALAVFSVGPCDSALLAQLREDHRTPAVLAEIAEVPHAEVSSDAPLQHGAPAAAEPLGGTAA